MHCRRVPLANGTAAIVCGTAARCACGRRADRLCDWKVPARQSGTCDRPLCRHCTYAPAPDKDLCRDHAAEWRSRPGVDRKAYPKPPARNPDDRSDA